jgi:hypothetical protein
MRRRERGSALIEGALVMTLFVGLLAGVLFASHQLHTQHALAEQLRWAARTGAVRGWTEAEIASLVVHGVRDGQQASKPGFQGLRLGDVTVRLIARGGDDGRVFVEARGVRMECPLESR